MRCYTCQGPVTREEWDGVAAALRAIDDDEEDDLGLMFGAMIDELGLVHCVGPDDLFDDDGTAITCGACFEGAVIAVQARERARMRVEVRKALTAEWS